MAAAFVYRLGWQQLGRRPARAALLAAAVAIGTAAIFAGRTIGRGAEDGLGRGFARLGADLMVVPRDTLVNLSAALLTAEPTEHSLPASIVAELAAMPGVERVAPQKSLQAKFATGAHLHEADFVAFDPGRDLTVQPWIVEHADRPFGPGDILVGGRRSESIGDQLAVGTRTLTVHGTLGVTGVGPFDRALFVSFDDVRSIPGVDGDRLSAILIRVKPGFTPEQVRFALAQLTGIKVVAGTPVVTSARHGLTAILGATWAVMALAFVANAILVGVLYSAVLTERRRELGVLLSIGVRRGLLVRTILAEAAMTTGIGGLCGLALGAAGLLLFRRTLGYYFESIDVPFVWPSAGGMAVDAALCVALAVAIGLIGAVLPAWRAGSREPYELVRAEGE